MAALVALPLCAAWPEDRAVAFWCIGAERGWFCSRRAPGALLVPGNGLSQVRALRALGFPAADGARRDAGTRCGSAFLVAKSSGLSKKLRAAAAMPAQQGREHPAGPAPPCPAALRPPPSSSSPGAAPVPSRGLGPARAPNRSSAPETRPPLAAFSSALVWFFFFPSLSPSWLNQ